MSFTTFNGFNFGKVQTQNVSAGGGGIGGWVELGRTTLGSAGDNITVSSLANKRYYMLLGNILPTGGDVNTLIRTGNGSIDSGNNYASRVSLNGGSEILPTSSTYMLNNQQLETTPEFIVYNIANYSTKEKLGIGHIIKQRTAGSGTAPHRLEHVGKWANTSNSIDRFDFSNAESGSFNTGSEVVVLGYDPSDTHTTNFWEELDTKENTTGSTSTFTSNTFTAKKYLWIQCFIKNGSASARNALFRFNGDSGNNYAHRRSQNGGVDSTQTTQANGIITDGFTNETGFVNIFVINNTTNEKLVICHSVFSNTTGAGVAPNRTETVSKWVNTVNQITSFSLIDTVSSDAFANGSIIKVWGSN